MCYKLDSESLLVNYFLIHRNSNEIRIANLKKIRDKLEETFKYKIYVDITYESLIDATHDRLFNLEGSIVKINKELTQSFYESVDEIYNWNLPKNYKEHIKEVLKNY